MDGLGNPSYNSPNCGVQVRRLNCEAALQPIPVARVIVVIVERGKDVVEGVRLAPQPSDVRRQGLGLLNTFPFWLNIVTP